MAIIAGKNNLLCHVPNSANPATASGAINPPPTLCATFQTDIFVPRSFSENQCTTTLPHGGHPMPWTQPLINNKQNMMVKDPVANGNMPITNMVSAERINPSERNTRALLLSETVPITNLLIPYAMEMEESAIPRSVLLYPC